MRGKIAIIALSTVLLLGNTGLYTTSVYGGGPPPVVFDGGSGVDPQDWNLDDNWNSDVVPSASTAIEIGMLSPGPPFFDVNIGDGISGVTVTIGDGADGSLDIFDQNSLTIKELSTLNHRGIAGGGTITVNDGATLTIDGILNNGLTAPEPATIFINGPTGKIVISSTGVLNHDFGPIFGDGEIECVGGGTFNENDFVAATITITGCQAPVGAISIPIDSTSLLLADTLSFSWMIPVVLSVLGIGLFVVSRKSENSKI